jgi:hypothetical protein
VQLDVLARRIEDAADQTQLVGVHDSVLKSLEWLSWADVMA